MSKGWVKGSSPNREDGEEGPIPALKIEPPKSIERILWNLPSSKSHAIRWLALAAQSNQDVVLQNLEHAGQDIVSMRRCLSRMGVKITDLNADGDALEAPANHDGQPTKGSVAWKVHGVGPNGLKAPSGVLDAGNSGTALRVLMALSARFAKH